MRSSRTTPPPGLLALATRYVAEYGPPERRTRAVYASEQAARRALALDTAEPNARLTIGMLHVPPTDWKAAEDVLRSVLGIDPQNRGALSELVFLMQAAGRVMESWRLNEQAVALDPLSPVNNFRRALKLWILGRADEADRVIALAVRRWPRHPWVWNARLVIYAFSGRPLAGLAMLDDAAVRPVSVPPLTLTTWRRSMIALDTRTPADVAVARAANLAAAGQAAGLAAYAAMFLSQLNEVDAAYQVIDGFLLRQGPLVGTVREADAASVAASPTWQETQWLFTPATAAVRADDRFVGLCKRIGLTDYWRARGIIPDYLTTPAPVYPRLR